MIVHCKDVSQCQRNKNYKELVMLFIVSAIPLAAAVVSGYLAVTMTKPLSQLQLPE